MTLLSSSARIIAHRGASAFAPENTMAAFRKAHEMGAQWVEFDIVLSQDGTPIVFHDATTTRTTDQPGHAISNLPLSEIKQLDAGSWFAPEFAGERIPTLAEVLLFLRNHNMQACIELKPTLGRERFTAMQVVKDLQNYWPQEPELLPYLSSFNSECLKFAREAHAEVPMAFTCKRWRAPYIHLLKELNCQAVHLNAGYVTATQVAAIKNFGYGVFCFTVNDKLQAERLFRWKVDAIFTDYPNRFV